MIFLSLAGLCLGLAVTLLAPDAGFARRAAAAALLVIWVVTVVEVLK